MENQIAQLPLKDEDEDELAIVTNGSGFGESELYLLGTSLTNKILNFMAMKHYMARTWRLMMGIKIEEIQPNLYMFKCFHVIDLQRDTGPWSLSTPPTLAET